MAIDTIKVSYKRLLILKENKEQLEKALSISLLFEDNTVHVEGEADKVYFAMNVIKAIAKGFSVQDALKLLLPDNNFDYIDLNEYCSTRNCMRRLKGRVIGKNGTIKKEIENATDSIIRVYGHSISFIAPYYTIQYVKEVIRRLLLGSKHSTILSYLSDVREQIFYSKLKGFPTTYED